MDLRRSRNLIKVLMALLLLWVMISCQSTRELVLDDPAFFTDMVQGALAGQEYEIDSRDFPDILELLESENPEHRQAAILLAAQAGPAFFASQVIAMREDDNPQVSEEALRFLSQNFSSLRPRVLSMLSDENPEVRIEALSLLSDIGGESMIPMAIRLLGDEDSRVLDRASLVMSQLASRQNLLLLGALESTDDRIRAAAWRTVGRFALPEDLPLFISMLASPEASLRNEAQRALLRQGELALPQLHSTAEDRTVGRAARLGALDVIQALESLESLDLLSRLLLDKDERIAKKSRAVLTGYGIQAVEFMTRLYLEGNVSQRAFAVEFLGNLNLPEIPLQGLDDSSSVVQNEATKALKKMGSAAYPGLRETVLNGKGQAAPFSLMILRNAGDPWLLSQEEGEPNLKALQLLIQESNHAALTSYFSAIEATALEKENVFLLREAWEAAEVYVQQERRIEEGDDPFFASWRRREQLLVQAQETLRLSFDRLHGYFDAQDPRTLQEAEKLREESHRLELLANRELRILEGLKTPAALERVEQFQRVREELVAAWVSTIPELRPLAESLFERRGLDPRVLEKESAILNSTPIV